MEVQAIKIIPESWYSDREEFENRMETMFDEISEFVNSVREDIGKHSKDIVEIQENHLELEKLNIESSDSIREEIREMQKIMQKDIAKLSGTVNDFITSHEAKHESEKGILKKIFGK